MSENKFTDNNQAQIVEATLELFDALEEGQDTTQRSLAQRIGIALGLTNSLLKRCVRKGLLKAGQAPARRYAYYLTPKGFSEKSRLTASYLSSSLSFFRRARVEYDEAVQYCAARGWQRLALFGAGDLAEIALLAGRDLPVEFIAVIDSSRNSATFCGLPILRSLSATVRDDIFDAVVITDSTDPHAAYDYLLKHLEPTRILAPNFLHITRKPVKSETLP